MGPEKQRLRKKIAVGGRNVDIEIYHHKLYENIKAYVK